MDWPISPVMDGPDRLARGGALVTTELYKGKRVLHFGSRAWSAARSLQQPACY